MLLEPFMYFCCSCQNNFMKGGNFEWSDSESNFWTSLDSSGLRCNFSLVACYSFKFTRCSLLFVKSLVTCCKILLDAEVTCWKNSFVTRCKRLQKITSYSLQNSLVARCKICLHSLLVAEVTRFKKSVVTRCNKSIVGCCNKSFITR